MTLDSVLWPVFAYVAMVFALLGALIVARTRARQSQASPALQAARDRQAMLVGASYANQFELPVLFFALVACGLAAGRTDGVFVAAEWLFVLTRFIHAVVHVTSNVIPVRGAAFAVGAAVLAAAWLWFAIGVVAAA